MVTWLKTEERLTGVKIEEVAVEKLLDSEWKRESHKLVVPLDDVTFDFDLRRLMQPLGKFWKVMYDVEDYISIKDALQKYWLHTAKPKVLVEMAETEKEVVYLRSKILTTEQATETMVDLNRVISDINASFKYNRTVIGTDGSNLEVQFLDSTARQEVKQGDFVDCGLFIHVNGKVNVAPGINRLVCTNGLTQRMNLLDGQDYRVNSEFLQRSIELATWLRQKAGQNVGMCREISVALRDYPKSYLNRFWKSWTERIDLKELTWFDVVSDVTAAVNRTLAPIRYQALAMAEDITAFETKECRCPTCSASV